MSEAIKPSASGLLVSLTVRYQDVSRARAVATHYISPSPHI